MAAAIPTLEPAARDLWPESFAGLWLGEDGYGDTIQIAFTEGAEEKVATLAQGFPRPELLRALTLDRSIAELESRQERMISDRELARAGTLALPGVPGARYDLGIDQSQNAVYVVLERATPEAVAAFEGLYGPDISVREGPLAQPDVADEVGDQVDEGIPEAPSCSRQDCRYKLRSGLNVYCTTAFTVRRPDGRRQILSAAHCPQSSKRHGGEHYGEVRDEQQRGRVDAERHSVEGAFSARPWIFVNPDEKRRKVRSRSTWAGVVENERVCKSGAISGRSCGKVLDKYYSPSSIPNANRFVKTAYCGENGDSGSGVYGADGNHPNRAYGIHSGGSVQECSDPRGPSNYSFFGHIEYAQDALNVTVVLAQ